MRNDSKIALIFCGVFVALLVFSGVVKNFGGAASGESSEIISVKNGVQIINIVVNGGYTPSYIEAEADMPTELRFITDDTYDCSSLVVIPALSYQKFLEPTATEKVDISAEQATGTLQGACGMGMYSFEIAFK